MSKTILNRIQVMNNRYLYQMPIVHIRFGFILLFGANYITFWRKLEEIILLFGANYITFWRKLYYFLAQGNFTTDLKSITYNVYLFLINNLKNNLTNYSNKLFKEERGTSQKAFGLFGRPLFPLKYLCIEKGLSYITSSMV